MPSSPIRNPRRDTSLLSSPLVVRLLKRKYTIPILLGLYQEGTLQSSDLARQVRGHPATVLKTLRAMEDLKLVTRRPANRDRRAVEVRITLKGIELVETAMSHWGRIFRKWDSLP